MAQPQADLPNFAAEADELSLADARSHAADDAVPDSVDVRTDSLMVMHGTLQRLRRPVIAVAAGLAITIAVVTAVGILTRGRNGGVDPGRGRVR